MAKLVTSVYKTEFKKLPDCFDGFNIVQLSDLHNQNFGTELRTRISLEKPDIIVITGDMIHLENDYSHSIRIAKELISVAPVYYVNGNHEQILNCYSCFIDELTAAGVKVLENEVAFIERDGGKIAIIGMSDPTFFEAPKNGVKKDAFKIKLKELSVLHSGEFKILLSHRPEMMNYYFECGIDLAFAGHAHGGQVRLPLIGPIYAPNQGLFPKLTSGVKYNNEKYLVINRGLGKSNFMPRMHNPPEIVSTILEKI